LLELCSTTANAKKSDGQSGSALPDSSNVDLFRYCKGVIHLDAKITHRAFYLGVAEQELYRSQIPRSPIDQGRLSPSQ
jgi:hypothetical protein